MSKVSNQNVKFYCLVYLTQMTVVQSNEFLDYSLRYFFDLFTAYTQKDTEEDITKSLSLVVKRINTICKFCSEKVKLNF
jgi:hypothetical protein